MKQKLTLAILLFSLSPFSLQAQGANAWLDPDYDTAKQAEAALKKKQLKAAFNKYKELYRNLQRKGQSETERGAKLDYNIGNLFYQSGDFKQASDFFMQAAEKTKKPELKSQALNNLGNSFNRQGNIQDAMRAFQEALQVDPKNKTAANNLERIVRQAVQQQKQQQQKQEQQQGEKNEEEKSDEKQESESESEDDAQDKDGDTEEQNEEEVDDKDKQKGKSSEAQKQEEAKDEEKKQAERLLDQYSEDKVKRRYQGSRRRAKKPW